MAGASLAIPTFAVGTERVCNKNTFAVAEKLGASLQKGGDAAGNELLAALHTVAIDSPVPLLPEGSRKSRAFRFDSLTDCHNVATVHLQEHGLAGDEAVAQILRVFSAAPPWGRLAILGAALSYQTNPPVLCQVMAESAADTRLDDVRFARGQDELTYEEFLSSTVADVLAAWGVAGRSASRGEIRAVAARIMEATRSEVASAVIRFSEIYEKDIRFAVSEIPSASTIRAFVEGLSDEGFERIRAAGYDGSLFVLREITVGRGKPLRANVGETSTFPENRV